MVHCRRWFLVCLVIAMIAVSATAFAAKTEITYMAWYNTTESEAADIQKTLDKFNASHDGIHVTLIAVSRADYETKLNTMAAAKQLPDTCMMAEPMTIRYAAAGLLADVGDMYKPDERPLKSLAFTYKGKTVGYSCANEVLLLYYNKKLFDAAKLPYPPASADKAWTWKQFVEVAKKLTKDKNGKTPNDPGFDAKNIVTYGADFNRLSWMWPVLAVSNGGGVMSPDGQKLLLGTPQTVQALQAIADLYLKDKVAPSIGDKNNMPSLDVTLLTGKVAMATSGQWEIGVSLKNSLKDGLQYGVGVLPRMKKAVTYNTGGPFVVFNSSKNLPAAKTFVRWISDEDNGWDLITGGIWMPVSAKWYASDEAIRKWADNPVHPPYAQYKTAVVDYAMNNAVQVPWYYFPSFDKLNDLIDSGMDQVWNGKLTAKQYITRILPRVKRLFEENRPK
ncbi:carbohydrate ABC transporter substrate-binding protein (CUT1 family) [Hydrogenispora ethanolica]|jgi:multiple sugar transport system substrate-binding protein|uniref:Carbohydrate ABC transporter substrate-binding protein (CUT1 family) n=1 Tax=Hydrogenispora ethanolica TaxID=1082276 RepID=A0A4R1SAR5_HYDET|nr:sugar ABC transporter substrate-binding protein [Hydrogenispora ethanolica]TCL76459.1 carbohydrate ABC transporter substrate-binding protein (CUT1 family) [Hydrogenispora ethanolica]